MIKDKNYKLIVALMAIFFAVGLFFGVRFLKNKIYGAINPSGAESTTTLNLDSWIKIKHHFSQ